MVFRNVKSIAVDEKKSDGWQKQKGEDGSFNIR